MTRIDPLREYCTVGLIFVDGTQIAAQHPNGGIKPLEGGEGINKEQVPRVVVTDMPSFVRENSRIVSQVIAAVHHDIMHPTEWGQIGVTGHTDHGTIRLRILLTMLNEFYDSEQRPEGMTKRGSHADEEQSNGHRLPKRIHTGFGRHIGHSLEGAKRHTGGRLYHNGFMQGDDAQRQYKRCHSCSQKHHAINTVERFAGQQHTVEHVEYR